MEENQLSASVMEAIRSGRKIDAIKQLRKERGLGLKESKHIVDREMAAYRASNPHLAQENQSSHFPMILVIVAIGLALYFYLTGSS